ncbi:MAG: bifunctional demethylmenaquinone methyltransferase/2-methoxy-6-polyprenyl-1,4-benzoquinol methylase UbiE [Bacteroidetes bacterium]|nr:MAG: bifunctional demethylmenaquinone methyltransferase/2-methoxy-6-polyprenyl-1,4-benzoquinol methylase UbiE [Bacteroidota bacterium]
MVEYKHDKVVPFKNSELGKKEQVADMFDRIAFRYDFLNRFLSGGIDIYWRKKAISELLNCNHQFVLDVATGTADMPIMMAKYLHPQKITGIDLSEGMLQVGRKKIASSNLEQLIELERGDCENLPFEDECFDAVTVAFGVRNFENLEKGLREMRRVLKKGGRLVILEFSKPKNPLFKKMCNFYFKFITPGFGKIFSRNKEAYQYLDESVQAFPEGEELIEILLQSGFSMSRQKPLTFGICSIYSSSK